MKTVLAHRARTTITDWIHPMQWIEEIKLRSAVQKESEALRSLTELSPDIRGTPGLTAIQVFVHATISGDYALHLNWDTPKAQPQGSPLGLRLKERLRPFGLLEHAVWIETLDKPKRRKK